MLKHAFFSILFLFSVAYGKIYDCFLFLNEYEVLEIRLNTLYDHVDTFVLVEARETFKGDPKPLHFEEHKHLYERFADKIIHVIIDEYFETADSWEREEYQRNQIARALGGCNDTDIILISDVDEIYRPECLDEITHLLGQGEKTVSCEQSIYRFYLNRKDTRHVCNHWHGTVAILYDEFLFTKPQQIRKCRNRSKCIPQAGWHFCSMGGHARAMVKFKSYSHPGCSFSEKKFREEVNQLPLVEIDSSFPPFVQENIDYLTELGLIDIDPS